MWRLTARDCDALCTALKAAGLGPSRVRCAHVVLHRAVTQAVRWGWLARSPVSYATRPDVPRSTIRPPDASDVRALITHAAAHDPGMACWLYMATATGARRGEICGLRWADIDFDQRSVCIERSVSATRAGVFVKPTKTGGVRRVSITAQAVEALYRPTRASGAERSTDRQLRGSRGIRLHKRSCRRSTLAARTRHPAVGATPSLGRPPAPSAARPTPLRRRRAAHQGHRRADRGQPARACPNLDDHGHLLGVRPRS